jgi:thioesterase domain-containing protein/aryl carrier-like protein
MATIFSTEYALVQVLLSWGLKPAATTGHSLGEYAAACLAGVLGLEDAVALVALRGQLLDKMPDAAMLAVPLSEAALSNRLRSELSIAAINGSENCVVSGPLASVESLRVALAQDGIEARRLPIALASHSAMVDPVADLLGERAAKMTLRLPRIPIVSNVTGSLLSEADARDPGYWGRHLRRTVRFADGLATLLKDPNHVFVEVGPGRTLATLAQIQPLSHAERLVVTTMRHQGSSRTDMETLLRSLGSLWCAGVSIDWDAFTHNERRQRVPLPTYPFERKHHVLKSTSEKEYPPLRLSPSMPVREHAPASRSPLHEEPASTASAMDRSSTEPPQPGSHAVNDVESVLAGIWQELLGVESVHADDNFFDCGGDSLIAVQLRANVKSRLNTHVSLHAMIEHPTFAGLLSAVRNAATILPTSVAPPGEQVSSGSKDVRNERESRPARRRSAVHAEEDEGAALAMSLAPPLIPPLATREKLMVRLADGAPGKAPLFLVQPVGGTVYTYLELQRHLRGDRPIYAFRASGMEPGEPIYTDIPAMASRCLEEVLSVQPEGPYLLGGHSGGGTIAYEMACQLADRGPASTLVWMADSGFTTQYQRMNVTGIEHVLEALSAFKDIAPKIWRSFTIALADDSVLREIVVANYKALASYNPKRTTADVVYIRARERDAVLDKHPEVGWMDLVDGDFAAHNAPGNHLTMLDRPFAATLARIVQRHVDQFLSTHPLAAT